MAQNNNQGEMDPELAALLGTSASRDAPPDFDTLFGGSSDLETPEDFMDASDVEDSDIGTPDTGTSDVDLNVKGFPEITKRFADIPHVAFEDPSYYKEAIADEGQGATRLHMLLQKYINTKDPKDRGVFRQQLIPAFWEFLRSIARKATGKLSDPKKYLLRYAILHPSFLEAENKELFSKLIIENEYNQPIYYMDEWFRAVGSGGIRNSSSDELKVAKSGGNTQQRQLLEKAEGKKNGIENLLKSKSGERAELEKSFNDAVKVIMEHDLSRRVPEVLECYNAVQRSSLTEIQETIKNFFKIDRELGSLMKDFVEAEEDIGALRHKADEEAASASVNVTAIDSEFETIRQMTKMCVGRQGNHFPILSKEYFHCTPNDIAARENVISQLAWIESIDPEVFCRYYKNKMNRIVPYVILLPNYGDMGICWEPFDRFNRAASRGRIAIPMYSKSLQVALLSALADLRWQVAKEKASYYWMEEGLTGYYYQWFSAKKLKGDVKESFVQDYILWITKESEGTQKLDKELRGVFWRYMPFSQPVKDKLKTRSFVYQELYQRDVNRSMSDGY